MKQVLVTVDTEVGELGISLPHAFELFIEGKVDGEVFGYQKIIELLDCHGAKGEFFVDVYPVKQFGEEKFAGLCQEIITSGHGVQLHTHPSSAFDPERRYLSDYSAEEQADIVAAGMTAIKKWTGQAPIAHRAGGYGINEASLPVLAAAGIRYDSSFHYQNPHCQLPLVHKNAPYQAGGVWEVPVSGYTQHMHYRPFGPSRVTFQKLDFRYGSSTEEIQNAIAAAPDDSVHVIFLHSFNFLDLRYNTKTKQYLHIQPVPELITQFEELLAWVAAQKDCGFSGFKDLKLDHLAPDYLLDIPTERSLFGHLNEIFQATVGHTIKT